MQNRFLYRFAVSLLAFPILLLAVACDSGSAPTATPSSSHGGPVVDRVSLIDALRKTGATVDPGGKISQPYLSIGGEFVNVNTQGVQVYEYVDESAARSDASKVAPDASVSGTHIGWVDQPHFYQSGKLLVLFVGTDAKVLSALESVLGQPFAEGPPNPSNPSTPTP